MGPDLQKSLSQVNLDVSSVAFLREVYSDSTGQSQAPQLDSICLFNAKAIILKTLSRDLFLHLLVRTQMQLLLPTPDTHTKGCMTHIRRVGVHDRIIILRSLTKTRTVKT